ncbi:(R,R)-butanediol dehydrogenase / meso-butanediol dehydrogenase / diacetyl reductase [Tranquillimonas rosea]|uniref:(R,R)-butanediol dehydrogenase / meso-butanediol dehydrogenase / diacetyl reductase n=1 Tax=Tranquillimonas rosea TaxID=641238 RepID=A0A1H9S7G7_9RHOB|nr:alcohol dehydrogenase catalytic domain-containing protein [Tranquillimonas rosea]SER80119.1 (R,R)-butanediol dehydrogenase / meso-butanediol dehydrogenase / diacetyl reductase [Tranquillimonas rosea]
MRAVRLHGIRDLRVEDMPPAAAPGPGEIALRVTAAGICGSDLHNFATGAWISRAPSVAGHELTGVVTACGAGADHVEAGDRVLVDSRVVCGTCAACRADLPQICEALGFVGEVVDGGFAESVTLPARNILRAPTGVADRHLAMAEPLAVALHALNKLAAPDGAPIAIAGCGAIGGLAALLAHGRGHPLVLIDRSTDRAGLVSEVTGGAVATLHSLGPDPVRHAIDATGATAVIGGLLDALAGGGGVALVGIGGTDLQVDPVQLVERETSLIGCHAFGHELAEVAGLMPQLGAALDRFIDAEIPLAAVPDAYARHLSGDVAGLKTIVRPDLD